MLIPILIAGSLLLALLLATGTGLHGLLIAVGVPLTVAAGFLAAIMLWPTGSSTDAVAVPFAALYALAGSIPGALIGARLRKSRAGRAG